MDLKMKDCVLFIFYVQLKLINLLEKYGLMLFKKVVTFLAKIYLDQEPMFHPHITPPPKGIYVKLRYVNVLVNHGLVKSSNNTSIFCPGCESMCMSINTLLNTPLCVR
jgi:hypothetical protein